MEALGNEDARLAKLKAEERQKELQRLKEIEEAKIRAQ